jgi:hypothetical protein
LPLQRSLWSDVPTIAASLGLDDLFPEGFGCWLDEEGNLYLEADHVARLLDGLPRVLTAEGARQIQRVQEAACQTLIERTSWAASNGPKLTPDAARDSVAALGSAIASILPYGMLMKFAPDALLGLLREMGDESPVPHPSPSSGLRLTQGLVRLAALCRDAGYTPARLEEEWPGVAPRVGSAVREFSRAQVGMGPLPWDEPGYDDPLKVLGALKVASPDEAVDRDILRAQMHPLVHPAARAAVLPPRERALRDLLTFWLKFLDRETWYVRRAFFVGMAPLLRRLREQASIPEHHGAETYLFMDIREIQEGTESLHRAEERRGRYFADHRYLRMHGIGAGRLASMMERL